MSSQRALVSPRIALKTSAKAQGYMASLLYSLEQCCDCVGITPLEFTAQAGYEWSQAGFDSCFEAF